MDRKFLYNLFKFLLILMLIVYEKRSDNRLLEETKGTTTLRSAVREL